MLAVLLSALVLALKYAVLPNIQNYQGDIVSRVATATGMDVSAGAIRGGWSGFRPYVEMENVVFLEPASSESPLRPPGTVALSLPKLNVSLSWWTLVLGQIQFGDIRLSGPDLALTRSKEGLIYFAGRVLNQPKGADDDGRLLNWLIGQPSLEIDHAALSWRDDMTPGHELRFVDVGLRIDKGFGAHHLGFVATPPATLARKLEARGDLNLDNTDGKWQVAGTLYLAATDASLNELRQHLTVPESLQSGYGNVRAWIDIDNTAAAPVGAATNPVRRITADLHVANGVVQIASDVAPIHLARLAGRVEYRQLENGLSVASKGLEFRTREGVVSPPADFSVMVQNKDDPLRAQGEITGNGIDLKVMTALLEYFPVGKDVRAVVATYSPRGVVRKSSFAWTGLLTKPRTYKLKGELDEFGVTASDTHPGISGFTGSVEGDDAGGKFSIASRNLALVLPGVFRAPLQFDLVESAGRWKMTPASLSVGIERFAFENLGMAGQFAGEYSRPRSDSANTPESHGAGTIDLKGKLSRAKALAVADYLPNSIAISRKYIDSAAKGGDITGAEFFLKGALSDFPFRGGKGGAWQVKAQIKDVDFRYVEGWPAATAINGELVFENTQFSARIDEARFFNAKLNRTTLSIDDLSAPVPMLAIDGSANARAEDVARYLRESPLVESIGGFTRYVALEGPGKLDLSLKIPLAGQDHSRVSGRYTVNKVQAKTIGALPISIANLNGNVVFTDAGIKSNNLSAVAFGQPLTIAINGGGEAGVAVDFAGRADLSLLGDVLPFKMPQQVSGATDFTTRISARGGATEIAVASSMIGVASTLPPPLTKRAEESRPLKVVFSNVGASSERIRVSMAGVPLSATSGSAVVTTDEAESRIDGRLQRRFDAAGNGRLQGGMLSVGEPVGDQPLPDGLWFTGKMATLNFDVWRQAFENFYPPATAAAGKTAPGESPVSGFDFKLGSLIAYGREFEAMSLKGRRANDVWAMSVDSNDLVGDFTWRGKAFNDRGLIRARLKKFILTDDAGSKTSGAAGEVVDASKEADFPALDIVADEFTYKGRWLGKLELNAAPQGANWKIDQLAISNGHANLKMDGLWQRYGDPEKNPNGFAGQSRTTMNIKLEANNLNPLFAQFGYGDYLKGGKGSLEGKLEWPGHTYQFQLVNLSGSFKVEASKGQFAKFQTGGAKLFGLLSLQSISRRLTLDFRDIFNEGFAFDKIESNVRIVNGIMMVDQFEMIGPAAEVKMAGQISLPAETYGLTLTYSPKLDESVAIGVGAVLTPVVGAAVLAGQKLLGNPFEKLLSAKYSVTGSWDNPQIETTGKTTAPGTVTAPAPAPTAAPAAAEPAPKKTP